MDTITTKIAKLLSVKTLTTITALTFSVLVTSCDDDSLNEIEQAEALKEFELNELQLVEKRTEGRGQSDLDDGEE